MAKGFGKGFVTGVAGAVGGCQAEIGTAACMAAGAIVEMMGGSPRQVGHAIALCMKNLLGLACDPVAGLVEVPCVKRNGFYAVHAITASEMALMNIESQIPPDEVIEAMNNIGRAMPAALRETSDGGLAVTPTGTAIAERGATPLRIVHFFLFVGLVGKCLGLMGMGWV